VRVLLAPSVRRESDALHRPYKDPLLAHPWPIPLPFALDESRKLLGHPSAIRPRFQVTTRLISARFQPTVNYNAYTADCLYLPLCQSLVRKPLPRDASTMQRPERNVFIGCTHIIIFNYNAYTDDCLYFKRRRHWRVRKYGNNSREEHALVSQRER
jgi:hypothetical protein